MKTLITLLLLFVAVTLPAEARQARSQAAKDAFKYDHPCPSNGATHGPCSGYVIDHVTALTCGGADAPANMQWQSVADGKAKDKWERKDCGKFLAAKGRRSTSSSGSHRKRSYSSGGSGGSAGRSSGSSSGYQVGPRGGCYTYSGSGKKRYVDHSYCS